MQFVEINRAGCLQYGGVKCITYSCVCLKEAFLAAGALRCGPEACRQVAGTVGKSKVAEGLWKVTKMPAGARIILLR